MEFEKSLKELEQKIEELKELAAKRKIDMSAQLRELEERALVLRKETFSDLSPWNIVQIMRHPERPHTLDYVSLAFTGFLETHGDRAFADDKAVITGFARLLDKPVGIVGTQKGRDTQENLKRNFGMAQPEGYRKALRFMRLCEKFRVPILCFVDTSGAYPGVEGEERSVAEAIGRNLFEMSMFRVPIIVVVIGEGGSGGALGIGVGDRILMLENGFYSVISPEGCAAILWGDRSRTEQAAEAMKGTAQELLKLGVIDEIVPEPLGGAHRDPAAAASNLKDALARNLEALEKIEIDRLLEQRYQKFRNMGFWEQKAPVQPSPAEGE